MTVLSNMDVNSEKDVGHGKKTTLFNPTPKMSTYVSLQRPKSPFLQFSFSE
jgi:aminopeptidase N